MFCDYFTMTKCNLCKGSLLFLCTTLLLIVERTVSSQPLTEKLSKSNYSDFISNGDGVRVVYFFKKELPQLQNFFVDVEKSAIIMEMYGAKFALVDCNEDSLGYCDEIDSQEKVYMFRSGHMMLDATLDSMFDVNSIVSNVLQVVLLDKAPIMQTASELNMLQSNAKKVSDVVIGYQFALGTYEHRIMMEIVHVFHEAFRFAVVTDQSAIEHLPGYSVEDKSALWYLKCKDVSSYSLESCPVYKYRGQMTRSSLANFFHMLQLAPLHNVSDDGDYNPYVVNGLDSVYIFHDSETTPAVQQFAQELSSAYLGLFGIVLVDVGIADGAKYGFKQYWPLPALALRKAREADSIYMPPGDTPVNFLANQLDLYKAVIQSEPVIAKSVPMLGGSAHCTGDHVAEDRTQEEADLSALYAEMEVEDDRISNTSLNLRNVSIARSHLPDLDDKTLQTKIRDKPLLYVLFYIPIEGKNDVSLRVFVKAAEALSSLGIQALAALNCYDWTNLCAEMNVTVYPTIRIYQQSSVEEWRLYTGLVTSEHLVNSVILHSVDSPLILSTEAEVEKFLSGAERLRSDVVSGVAVLGAFSTNHKSQIRTFTSGVERFQNQLMFGLVVNDQIASSVCQMNSTEAPCVVIHKRRDTSMSWASKSMQEMMSVSEVVEFIQQNLKSSIPELTAQNFLEYLARGQVFVVAFTRGDSESSLVSVLHMASQHLQHSSTTAPHDVAFLWMNTSSPDGTAVMILRHHVPQPNEEELIIIDREKGSMYRYQSDLSDVNGIVSWLQSSLSGKFPANGLLEPIDLTPRYAGYDFLRQLELDAHLPPFESLFEQDSHQINALADDLELEARGRRDTMPSRDMKTLLEKAVHHDVTREAQQELDAISKSRLSSIPHHRRTMKKSKDFSESGSTAADKRAPSAEHSTSHHVEL